MTSTWRKIENENGVPFYLSETKNLRQWDHPKFSEIRQSLDECNYVKYSSYRLALKYRVIQHCLHMDEVPLSIIVGVFDRHRLGANESSLCLESCDLEAVLSDIYFAANKKNHTNTDIDFATELMLNFLYNVFDKNRLGKIQVSSAKIVLAILSNCTLSDLNRFIFTFCADHNNCVTRSRLKSLLRKLVDITAFLHEEVSFGQHLINFSIENCFSKSPGLVGINDSMFLSWLESIPQILAWLPLLHRIKSAETVLHSGKCTTCKVSPIMGLRYKCTKCSSYTQCQKCFFTGRTSSSHKLSHSMKEHCVQKSPNSFRFPLIKSMCRLFICGKTKPVTQSNSVSIVHTKPLSNEKDFLVKSQSTEAVCDIEPLSTPQNQLQVVIRQLELQNRELHQILLLGSHSDKDIRRYLEEHRLHVSTQIQKLKILKHHLNVPPKSAPPEKQKNQSNPVESTPMVENPRIRTTKHTDLDVFSPIVSMPEVQNEYMKTTKFHIQNETNSKPFICDNSSIPLNMEDISSWIGGHPTNFKHDLSRKSSFQTTPVKRRHNDLDDALVKLQQILANNFTLDESLGNSDNSNLKQAVSEVEGMLTSLIDNVETRRNTPIMQPYCLKYENDPEYLCSPVL